MNPRDCWYWKSGNCLNARCSFRHLPLEGKSAPASSSIPTASGASTSAAHSKPQLGSATSTTATVVPSKSKTPCYFFSQGYCAKNEKCTFLHGSSVASPAGTIAEQKPANRLNGKAMHTSGGPVSMPKQNGLAPQEARPVTDGRPMALNEARPVSFKASVPVQGMHQGFNGLERARLPERVATSVPFRHDDSKFSMVQADRLYDVPDLSDRQKQSQLAKKTEEQGLPDQSEFAQAGDFGYQNGCRSDTLWEVGPSGGVSDRSIQSEEGEHTSQSDSQQSMKGLSNSPLASNGQDSFDTNGRAGSENLSGLPEDDWELESSHKYNQPHGSLNHARQLRNSANARTGQSNAQRVESEGHNSTGDLRNHLAKRRKNNVSLYLSPQHPERRGQSDVVSNRQSQRLIDGLPKQQSQEVEAFRKSSMKVDFNGVRCGQFDGRGSSDLPLQRISPNEDLKAGKSFKKVQSRGSAGKPLVMAYPKVDLKETEKLRHNSQVAPISEKRLQSSSRSTSKSSHSENMKEALTFTGPKSLAQIKAEKMAGVESASKAIGRHDPITNIAEAGAKLADSKLPALPESRDVASSDGKVQRDTVKKCDSSKQKMPDFEEFEGPKPLSLLLKRKRDVESDSDLKETMSSPNKAKVFMPEPFREMEDGEVGDDDDESKEQAHDISCSLVPPQEDSPLMSPSNAKEGGLQGLQRTSEGEATEFHMESSEDGLKDEMEMEDNAYGEEDYEIDDDDEDDFAKKLGRFFALSNE
eukprot:c23512_g1_i1 orf=1630-3885(+)